MPRRKGYKHLPATCTAITRTMTARWRHIQEALAQYTPPKPTPKHVIKKPPSTPIPPSASPITTDHIERYGLYAYHAAGEYYYKRGQCDHPTHLYRTVRDQALTYPLWTYIKTAHVGHEQDLTLPIRIPLSAIPALGPRFQSLKERKTT